MPEKFKRRNYFINKPFQAKFILKFCLVVFLSSLVIGVLVYYFFQDATTVAIENTQVVVKSTTDFILPIIANILILVTVGAASAVILITLMTSHKISGPLYRIQREVELLSKGDLRRNFRIRGNDQLQELAKSLNQMCNSLRDNELEVKKSFDDFKKYYMQNRDNISEKESAEIDKHFLQLENKLNNFIT